MVRIWKILLAAAAALALLAGVVLALAAKSDSYELHAFVFPGRVGQFDEMIARAAERQRIDPALVKAVIWRESKFQPRMTGAHGERGLMQVTEGAASDWARAEKIETFRPPDLFDPKVNIEAGTWYLAQALRRWSAKDDPVPFALAEYNAGRQRVLQWESRGEAGAPFGAEELRQVMDFPTTRRYISDIVKRYEAFRQAGEFSAGG